MVRSSRLISVLVCLILFLCSIKKAIQGPAFPSHSNNIILRKKVLKKRKIDSSKSIETARSTAIEQGVPNAEISVGDAEDLTGFESESFDVIHVHQVLLHQSRPLHAASRSGPMAASSPHGTTPSAPSCPPCPAC